jgi:uncharacterized damage-inducible protein DinB
MQELIDLFRHNSWANDRVFDVVAGTEAGMLDVEAPGTRDTVRGTLAHLTRVEDAYFAMIEERPRESLETRERYAAHDLSWFRTRIRELGSAYEQLLATTSRERLERTLAIPWFDFRITVREGLLQVLTHSSQHRSQVLSWLSAQGVVTPDLDYVLMLQERHQDA